MRRGSLRAHQFWAQLLQDTWEGESSVPISNLQLQPSYRPMSAPETSPWGAVTRQRRRPHTPIFYTTTLPSLTPQPCGRRDVSSLTQGWIVPWSMRRSFHVDQPCPCKWGWSVITIPVAFLGPCEVSFPQLTQYLNLVRGARGL